MYFISNDIMKKNVFFQIFTAEEDNLIENSAVNTQ